MRTRALAIIGGLGAMLLALVAATSQAEMVQGTTLWINEFLADNDGVIADEFGEYDDVLELYNPGSVAVNLGGCYLTDDLADPTKFRITDTVTIPAGGYLLFWADSSPDQGIYHTNFSLSKSGEEIGLYDTDANGNAAVDTHTFGAQPTDISEGRCPDGGSTWLSFDTPTMASTNEPCGLPPSISGTAHEPAFPSAGEAVTVTAVITDDGVVVTASLWYSAGLGYQVVPMTPAGADRYRAEVPGQAQDRWVQYYVAAEDDAGRISTDPPGAPTTVYGFVAGYVPPGVYLNELMADNLSTLEDPDEAGEFPDWFELHNPGSQPVELGGLYLTDYLAEPTQFRIPDGIELPAGGFLTFYADGEPEQGPLHTNFKLSAGGEALALFGAGGKVRLDSIDFPPLAADQSFGRQPDGSGSWFLQGCSTPGMPNGCAHRVWLPFAARNAGPPRLPLRLDCGGDAPYAAEDGTIYQADHAWTPGAPYGYIGGFSDLPEEWWEGNPVGGTQEWDLYKSLRRGWSEYRFSQVPDGNYLLTLRFNDQIYHGPEFSVFDLSVEGQLVLHDLDVWAEVGRYHALDIRIAAAVADGELNVTGVASAGETHVAALELVARAPDTLAPAIPQAPMPTASYGSILLDWADNPEDDLAGYNVYRSGAPAGPYTRLNVAHPVFLSRFEDLEAAASVPLFYRISAVDVYGNESGQSAFSSGTALDAGEAMLPLYRLEVAPEDLHVLYSDPWLDSRVDGIFASDGITQTVEVRFRGSSGRGAAKKSWKIVFPSGSPFPYHDRINVNANWMDATLFRSRLASTLFEAAGQRPPESEHVLLTLNGDYYGVYTRNEQVDEGLLERTGRATGASIYKVVDRFGEILPDEATYRAFYEKETNEDLGYEDLIQFIEMLNYTPDEDLAAVISAVMDVEAFLDHYAIQVLTANIDSARHNLYLVHDLATDKWELLPWDLDMTFYDFATPIDMGAQEHPETYGGWNILRTRVLAVPEFRAIYCDRLSDYMNTVFSDAAMFAQVDSLYAAIEQDGLRDWRKMGWESTDYLTAAPANIKAFIAQRKQFLRSEMVSFCPAE